MTKWKTKRFKTIKMPSIELEKITHIKKDQVQMERTFILTLTLLIKETLDLQFH